MATVKREVLERFGKKMGLLTIDNPPMNLFTKDMLESLSVRIHDFQRDPEVAAIIITGSGMAFAAGVDVRFIYEMAQSGDRGKVAGFLTKLHLVFGTLHNGLKPTIAAINGYCFGGGLELALACDFMVASKSPTVQFACPEINRGIIPGLGASQRLPRRIGFQPALKMMLAGIPHGIHSGSSALQAGLIEAIFSDQLISEAADFAGRVLEGFIKQSDRRGPCSEFLELTENDFEKFAKGNPLYPARTIVRMTADGLRMDLHKALFEVELPALLDCLFKPDALEGLASFLEKRPPVFEFAVGQVPVSSKETVVKEKAPAVIAATPPWESEECQMLRQTIREFGERELSWPKVVQMEKAEAMPKELWNKMAEMGLFGTSFPEEEGGYGLGKVGACILADELTYFHPSTAVTLGAHASLACEALHLFGNKDQKEGYLGPGIRGSKIGAFVTTEPGVGSDVANIKTVACKVNGGWRLKGEKQFVSNGEIADFIVVVAQTSSPGDRDGLSMFIVDRGSSGLSVGKHENKVCIRASCTNGLALDDVFVPDANVLGEVGRGFKMTMQVFNRSRISVAASCIGIMRRAIDEAWNFAKDRMLFGEPLYMKQNTVMELGRMQANLFAVKSAVFNAAWMMDRGLDIRNEAAAVKYFAAETASEVVDRARQLHAGAGSIEDYPIAMFWRDVVIFRVFEGTSEVQALALGKELIKSKLA